MRVGFGKSEIVARDAGYRVDGLSVVSPRGRKIKPSINDGGYPAISLRRGTVKCLVHRLVALCHFGEIIYTDGMVVRHLDSNKLNFLPENLAVGTQRENIMDRSEADRMSCAMRATTAIKRHDHAVIISFHAESRSYLKTCAEFGIRKSTLHFILKKSEAATKLVGRKISV